MMYVTGVSYVGSNNKKRTNQHTKRYPMVYYYDESGDFRRKRVSRFEAIYYKRQICKQVKIFCTDCKENFNVLVKKNQQPTCPKCLS